MAIGTLLTGIFIFASTASPNQAAFLVFNCLEALFQNIMYGTESLFAIKNARLC